ncbi:hypothetical protein HHL21_12330 [Massilia sp. RP-1-19]|uniref:HipA-like kinase domain-containing protein n=1 Tax=Massilia polaris TaxID=2728846 RepID=A0A848HT39_9BURK|nr:HipA family kinase [Massilia polaris]NML61848.1 hypothetical protein [Massilia polaris]
MLTTVVATGFKRKMKSGRTFPCLLECEDSDGNTIEVVTKYSSTLFEKEKNLAIEAIVAMLAADLGLPVPEPFVVELQPEFIAIVDDPVIAKAMSNSCSLAFGSAFWSSMNTWLTSQKVTKGQVQVAAEIAIFDQIIVNSDRLPTNPNLLFTGDSLMMIDHELSLAREQVLFWREPWVDGGLSGLDGHEKHIFGRPYFSDKIQSLERFAEAWEAIPAARFDEYLGALPSLWVYDQAKLSDILAYLNTVRSNIRTITENAMRVYS